MDKLYAKRASSCQTRGTYLEIRAKYSEISGTYLCIKNGQATYDKKAAKNMTSKQARSVTSFSRFTSTRQYDPID